MVMINRLLHIHENRPGMMNSINKVFTEENINVAAQFLRTSGNVGYVVIDITTQTKAQAELVLQSSKHYQEQSVLVCFTNY